MHAVIIAGGLGTRAHGMTGDRIPKALLLWMLLRHAIV